MDAGVGVKLMLLIVAAHCHQIGISGQSLLDMVSEDEFAAITGAADDCGSRELTLNDCSSVVETTPLYDQIVNGIDTKVLVNAFNVIDETSTCPTRLQKRDLERQNEYLRKELRKSNYALFTASYHSAIVAVLILSPYLRFDELKFSLIAYLFFVALVSLIYSRRYHMFSCYASAITRPQREAEINLAVVVQSDNPNTLAPQ